jgi:DNA-directed RNA polymerase subunit K/omega
MDEEDIIDEDYQSGDEIDEVDEINMIHSNGVPDSIDFYSTYNKNFKDNITDPCLTKYEKTKILSERTQQIENGSIIYIPLTDTLTTAYSIALEEFKQKKLPFIICRPLPNSNGYEYWKLNDLMY